MSLSNETMEDLARAKPGVIDKVLFNIKTKIESKEKDDAKSDCLILEGFSDRSSGESFETLQPKLIFVKHLEKNLFMLQVLQLSQ